MTMDTQPHPQPLLDMQGISKIYNRGGVSLRAVDEVSLRIDAGEFVALMGQSGSGKSTLMNIIGCLDRPTSGRYRINGQDTAELDRDALASLRRDTFGFIFQRYNLLATATATENVEIPAIYAGLSHADRLHRAHALLAQLGLAERADHRPNELSGGQQQRVAIARALMNGADIILADEPTGALDSQSGAEVLALLQQLHQEGHTILLITHDAEVAAHAERIIQISDGRIVDDSGARTSRTPPLHQNRPRNRGTRGLLGDISEATKMALRSLHANVFRSSLTLLGIVIGVAAVVAMMAIGNGSKQSVMARIQSMGTNLLIIRPGGAGMRHSDDIITLTPDDATAIAAVPGVTAVSPERSTQATLRNGNIDYRAGIQGVWPDYIQVHDWPMAAGGFITASDMTSYAPVIVLGQTVVKNLFPNGGSPLGQYVLVKNVPFEVVGVLAAKGATPFGSDQDDIVLVPQTTAYMRLFGTPRYVGGITVKVADAAAIDQTQAAINELLKARHNDTQDFQIRNTASFLEMAETTQNTFTVLLGAVAAISLLVGGIGVMNIMLVNVTERRREIGIRMATGARTGNILLQFNTEALVICGLGGAIGVGLGIGAAVLLKTLGIPALLSPGPALLAFTIAFLTGLLFGFLPARQAAHLDPVEALAAE